MMNSQDYSCSTKYGDDDEEEVQLPGFRFHPTDEELVGFYLRRKVDRKPISIELIKQVEIYKYDPWDLPKSSSIGDSEGYFFCKRGRKYKNSIRPNRVTGSGFWKATGIDKPVYSNGEGRNCIGLKKTLVYYRGSAGKGTKTDWMMHEFRLPNNDNSTSNNNVAITKTFAQEAEVWTLCRIFKRNVSYRKYTQDWRELSTKRRPNETSSKSTCSVDSNSRPNYVGFGASLIQNSEKKPVINHVNERINPSHPVDQWSSITDQPPSMASSSNISTPYGNELFTYAEWDELRSVVEYALDPSLP